MNIATNYNPLDVLEMEGEALDKLALEVVFKGKFPEKPITICELYISIEVDKHFHPSSEDAKIIEPPVNKL